MKQGNSKTRRGSHFQCSLYLVENEYELAFQLNVENGCQAEFWSFQEHIQVPSNPQLTLE